MVMMRFFRVPSLKSSTQRHLQRVASILDAQYLVLDVGCGSGNLPGFLAKNSVQCIGTDIRVAESFHGIKGMFVHADATKLPFRPEVFGTVVSDELMSHVRDHLICLREQIRVLRSAGDILLIDGNLLSPFILFDLLFLYPIRTGGRRGGLRWLMKLGKDVVYENYLQGTPQKDEELHSKFYWEGLFNMAGLKNIRFPFTTISKTYISATKP